MLEDLYAQGQDLLRSARTLPHFKLSILHVATLANLIIDELCKEHENTSTRRDRLYE